MLIFCSTGTRMSSTQALGPSRDKSTVCLPWGCTWTSRFLLSEASLILQRTIQHTVIAPQECRGLKICEPILDQCRMELLSKCFILWKVLTSIHDSSECPVWFRTSHSKQWVGIRWIIVSTSLPLMALFLFIICTTCQPFPKWLTFMHVYASYSVFRGILGKISNTGIKYRKADYQVGV